MSDTPFTLDQIEQFDRDGYLIVSGMLDSVEQNLLRESVRADQTMQDSAMDVRDAEGKTTNLSLWNHPGDDICGRIARCERVVLGMAQLLGDEVYHYHSKLSAKQPKVGGAWQWHQDYGYWYDNGCLFPDMASVFIAIDPATRENGCMQVLRGSHHLGRINHGRFGEQTGADPKRVAAAATRLEHVYCEMESGDGLFFHGNLLHASDPNMSDDPRWGLICCYNTAHNDPYEESHHPGYTPIDVVADSAVREAGTSADGTSRVFLRQEDDQTTA